MDLEARELKAGRWERKAEKTYLLISTFLTPKKKILNI